MSPPRRRANAPLGALVLAGVIAVSAGWSAGCSGCRRDNKRAGLDAVFSLDQIPDFYISLDDDGIQDLLDKPKKFTRGAFRWKRRAWTDIGVRIKGNRSMRRLDGKSAFKLRFDRYDEGKRIDGRRSLTLNNLVEDPTMIREILGYRVMREMGVAAPMVGYARVHVNSELYGLYAVVESVDEAFLAKHFADASGGLYEGEFGCDLFPQDVFGFDRDGGSDEDRAALAALARAAWPPEGAAERLFYAPDAPLDRERVLAYLAVSAFIGDFDGYRHAHNYRLYHDPARGKWQLIPWGFDRVLKKRLDIYDSQGIIAKRCFADARCRLDYARTMREVAGKFEALSLDEAVDVMVTLLADAIADDPRKPYKLTKMRARRLELRKFIRERPDEVRAQLGCLADDGSEIDADGDGHGCIDCDDRDPSVHPGADETCDGVDRDCSGLADDGPACPCPTVEIEGATFALCKLPMPWAEAAAFCKAQGATLARIDSEDQSRALRRAASKRSKDRWWIGLSEREEAGVFRWQDGAPVTFTRWAKGEPDDGGCSQVCVALKDKSSGKWHDTHCGQHRPFICRLPDAAPDTASTAR